MSLVAPEPDLVVIESEQPLFRGSAEPERFPDRDVEGPTTSSST